MKQKTAAQKVNLLQASVDKYIGRIDGIWLELWIGEIRRCVSTLDDEVATMCGYKHTEVNSMEQTPELINRIRMLRKHAESAGIELTVKSDCNEADVNKAAAELSYLISRGS